MQRDILSVINKNSHIERYIINFDYATNIFRKLYWEGNIKN